MSDQIPLRGRLLLSTAVAAGCLSLFATGAQAATPCSPGKVHDRHGHCVVPAHRRAVRATAAAAVAPVGAAAAASTAVAPSQMATSAMAASPPRNTSENITVTGSLFRDPNLTSASPIERLTSAELSQRGIKTVTDALQLLSSNGSGSLTNAFSANGAFATGASAPSLRGLQTSATLVLMDGMRLSYYPLADDGSRNFVDTNWIPQSLIQRIDVQQDGGSATYGADAVAGVINMVTREEIHGFEGNAEGGLAQGGYGGHQRLYANYGFGDLNRDGYNFYLNSEYQSDDMVTNSQLSAPYNTSNFSGLTGVGGNNGQNAIGNIVTGGAIQNIAQTQGVVAFAPDGSTPYQLLNPASGCHGVGQVNSGYYSGPPGSVSTVCQVDALKNYGVITPYDRRVEATAHLVVKVGDNAKLVTMLTYSQNLAQFTESPATYGSFYANTQNEQGTSIGVLAPAILPNGQLNPNDPFAAQGQAAQLFGAIGEIPTTTAFSQNYRASTHLTGWVPSSWGGDWDYDASVVGMNTHLTQVQTGNVNIGDLNSAVENGTYNFVNQGANSQAAILAIAPTNTTYARTQEYSFNSTLSKGLFHLPGGLVNFAIGTNIRYEGLDSPNANPTIAGEPDNQYENINAVSAVGHRYVYSGLFELNVPVVKMLNADFSGRYDAYSEGFSHFSPKIGVTFKPTQKFMLRGTWSEGFQVPSFFETNGSTIGYTNISPTSQAFINEHLSNGVADTYAQAAALGQQTVGSTSLRPVTNNTFTGGPVFNPVPWVTASAEYYYIRENGFITGPTNFSTVAQDYYALQTTQAATVDGYNVIPGPPDPLHPNASRAPGIITGSYTNATSYTTDGVDLNLSFHHRLPGFLRDVEWFSNGHATWVHRLNEDVPGQGILAFAGTEGPYETVSASGTPRWRANWQNTFTWRKLSSTLTAYYTSGYKSTAADYYYPAGGPAACPGALYLQVNPLYPEQCHVRHFWDIDLTENYQFTKNLSAYVNIYNLVGFKAPYDYGTYGSALYNSAWSQSGVIGRAFRFGVNAAF